MFFSAGTERVGNLRNAVVTTNLLMHVWYYKIKPAVGAKIENDATQNTPCVGWIEKIHLI
jgi:hypothetical protein